MGKCGRHTCSEHLSNLERLGNRSRITQPMRGEASALLIPLRWQVVSRLHPSLKGWTKNPKSLAKIIPFV